jgi:hypothetical protein
MLATTHPLSQVVLTSSKLVRVNTCPQNTVFSIKAAERMTAQAEAHFDCGVYALCGLLQCKSCHRVDTKSVHKD